MQRFNFFNPSTFGPKGATQFVSKACFKFVLHCMVGDESQILFDKIPVSISIYFDKPKYFSIIFITEIIAKINTLSKFKNNIVIIVILCQNPVAGVAESARYSHIRLGGCPALRRTPAHRGGLCQFFKPWCRDYAHEFNVAAAAI